MTLDSKDGYDLYASEYKKDHPHLDSFDWDTSGSWLKEALSNSGQNPLKVLDLGCGDARVLARIHRWVEKSPDQFPSIKLFGTDLSPVMLKLASKRCPSGTFVPGDLREPGLWPRLEKTMGGKADVVISFFVLVHLSNPGAFFQSVKEILRPGGAFIFNTIPQRQTPVLTAAGKKFTIEAHHWESQRILTFAQDHGFDLLRRDDRKEKGELTSTVFWATLV